MPADEGAHLLGVGIPPRENGVDVGALGVQIGIDLQPPRSHVHGHKQGAIFPAPLKALANADPAPTPAPLYLPEQPHLNLVPMHHHRRLGHVRGGERSTEAPPFHAA